MDDFTLIDFPLPYFNPKEETIAYLQMYARQMQRAGTSSAPIARG